MAKVMISIPDDDLARIDHEAARRGTSRIRRGQQLLAGIEPVDTTAMIRHDRDPRDDHRPSREDA
jgi:hypothetical protein